MLRVVLRWEKLGDDLVLLPATCMQHPAWAEVGALVAQAGATAAQQQPQEPQRPQLSGEVASNRGHPGGDASALLEMQVVWTEVAAALRVRRLARQAPVANTGTSFGGWATVCVQVDRIRIWDLISDSDSCGDCGSQPLCQSRLDERWKTPLAWCLEPKHRFSRGRHLA